MLGLQACTTSVLPDAGVKPGALRMPGKHVTSRATLLAFTDTVLKHFVFCFLLLILIWLIWNLLRIRLALNLIMILFPLVSMFYLATMIDSWEELFGPQTSFFYTLFRTTITCNKTILIMRGVYNQNICICEIIKINIIR